MSAASLGVLLRTLKLPSFVASYEELGRQAEHNGWSCAQYLHHLVELELNERQQRRIERLRKGSGLSADKTLAMLKTEKLPIKVRRQLPALCEGAFIERAENVLAFGLPGR